MHPMLNIAIQAVRQSSKIILRYVDQMDKIEVSEKSQNDLVTQVDRLSEEAIIEIIREKYPNHTILAEESGLKTSEQSEYCWIIDPLDGTKNFVHGFPQFAISIALTRNHQLEIAAVYDPIRQELFTATRGQGAYLNSRRIRVSQVKKMGDALIGTGFPFRDKSHFTFYLNTFQAVFPKASGVRRAGAAALDLAYVAAGRLDGFWEAALKPWDMAAGVLMIKEAGGMVSDFQNEGNFLNNGNIVAGNPKIHKELVALIQQSLQLKNGE